MVKASADTRERFNLYDSNRDIIILLYIIMLEFYFSWKLYFSGNERFSFEISNGKPIRDTAFRGSLSYKSSVPSFDLSHNLRMGEEGEDLN